LRREHSFAQFTLQREIDGSPGSHLVEVRFEDTLDRRGIVRAAVRGPNPPSAAQVAAMEAKLLAHLQRAIRNVHKNTADREAWGCF
jgi:hypothetical protein